MRNIYPENNKIGIEVSVDDSMLPDFKYLKGIVRFLVVYPTTIFGLLWLLALYLFAVFVAYSISMYVLLWLGFFGGLPQ